MSINLVARRGWGALGARSRTGFTPSKPSSVHWMGPTTTVGGKTTWGHDKCAGLVRGIQNYHMDANGWSDIAYNFLVCPHGVVFEGRGLNIRSAANGTNSGNSSSHAVCALAGEGNPFGDAEKKALRDCRDMVANSTRAPGGLMCHSDHKSTACPGDARRSWVKAGQPGGGGPASPRPERTYIREGDSGDHVKFLQAMFNIIIPEIAKQGYTNGERLVEDGHYGPATASVNRSIEMFWNQKGPGQQNPIHVDHVFSSAGTGHAVSELVKLIMAKK